MKKDIKHLQQTKCPNVYPTPPGNYRSFWTTDCLVICWRSNRVGLFSCPCAANILPPRAPTRHQHYWHNYILPCCFTTSMAMVHPNQHFQRLSYRPHANRHYTMGYPYLQVAIYTNPSRRPPFHLPIKSTTSTKQEGLTSQVIKAIIVTQSKSCFTGPTVPRIRQFR